MARVGDVAVGTVFETLLTKRRGVVRAQGVVFDDGPVYSDTGVEFSNGQFKRLHPDVRVRVVSVVTH